MQCSLNSFLSFFLSFFLITLGKSSKAQINEIRTKEATFSKEEIINLNYPFIDFKLSDKIILRKKEATKVSSLELFRMDFNPYDFIIATNFSFKVSQTTYKKCSVYEYKSEKRISEFVVEKYIELGVLQNNKILVRYQLKDLSSYGTFYRELAEIKNVKQLDLINNIKIYPNPFKREITVKLKDESILESIVVMNSLGQDVSSDFQFITLSEKKKEVIAKKRLKKGVYILIISTDNYVVSKKIVK